MLKLRDIAKTYHDGDSELTVLQGVDLDVAAGQGVALVGASGSGKSTLLQIAAGLEPPDQGQVWMLGRALTGMTERELAALRRRHLGFVFQQYNLLPGLVVRDNLLFQRRLNRMPDHGGWIDVLIEGLLLGDLLDRPVEVLSGGQQQRVAIGRALAHRPDLVFADEPTGNLHDAASRRVMRLFTRLVEEAGSALLLVTHNSAMAESMQRCHRLQDGHLHAAGEAP